MPACNAKFQTINHFAHKHSYVYAENLWKRTLPFHAIRVTSDLPDDPYPCPVNSGGGTRVGADGLRVSLPSLRAGSACVVIYIGEVEVCKQAGSALANIWSCRCKCGDGRGTNIDVSLFVLFYVVSLAFFVQAVEVCINNFVTSLRLILGNAHMDLLLHIAALPS